MMHTHRTAGGLYCVMSCHLEEKQSPPSSNVQELHTMTSSPCLSLQTYIGTLLVSVNPYKELDIYSKNQMDIYMGVNFFELPPHM